MYNILEFALQSDIVGLLLRLACNLGHPREGLGTLFIYFGSAYTSLFLCKPGGDASAVLLGFHVIFPCSTGYLQDCAGIPIKYFVQNENGIDALFF